MRHNNSLPNKEKSVYKTGERSYLNQEFQFLHPIRYQNLHQPLCNNNNNNNFILTPLFKTSIQQQQRQVVVQQQPPPLPPQQQQQVREMAFITLTRLRFVKVDFLCECKKNLIRLVRTSVGKNRKNSSCDGERRNQLLHPKKSKNRN